MFKNKKNLLGGAGILFATTFASYIMGLLRDRIFAQTFGAGRELDIYNAAFIVPDLLLTIFISSALSPAFIPLFTSLNTQKKKQEADQLATTVIFTAMMLVVCMGIILALAMPLLTPLIAPGFNGEEQALLIKLARLMTISPIFIALSSALGAMLISYKNFLSYGISTVLYNGGIILGTFLVPWLGIYGLVVGTLIGVGFHLLPRLIAINKTQFKLAPHIHLRDPHFIKMLKLMLPKMVGHPVEQLKFLGFTRIATLLVAGSVTAVSFARNFQSVPVALVGMAFSVAAFPLLSEYATANNRTEFMKIFWQTARSILILTVPASIALGFFGDIPIRIFLGGGKFTDEGILRTAQVLGAFALSIPLESFVHLLARSFYSLKNTSLPVACSLLGLVISVGFAYLRYEDLDIVAIPYGFFVGSLAEVGVLSVLLLQHVRRNMGT